MDIEPLTSEEGRKLIAEVTRDIERSRNLVSLLKLIGSPGKCLSCEAEIFWVRTKTGKNMPITPDGLSHFADCPNANQHRRKP